jgi:phenylpropionate dioxygenase-like ring-hydroxylating dioxygenase large terminal subunit
MMSPENNDLLTLTGPGTPAGNLFRRYWLPACLSEELPKPECPPVRVKLMGEDLVAFRDRTGRVGLVGEHCPHRGVSLFYGRSEDCGLRCIYHGWLMDADGQVLETPAESEDNTIRNDVRHLAYPTHEVAGVVFAYLGPPDSMPLFPNYRFAEIPKDHTYVTKSFQECNYLQGLEGECDSAHLSFLHRALSGPLVDRTVFTSRKPAYDYERTNFGLRLIATRAAEDDGVCVRVSSFVMPVTCWVPARAREAHIYVPIDDTHSWRYDLGMLEGPVPEGGGGRERFLDGNYRKLANRANDYLQDREMQRLESFTGMDGLLAQDSCVTETMGPRFDRSKEYLGQSDAGVVAVRNVLLRAIRGLEKGNEPPHIVTDGDANLFTHIDACQVTVFGGTDWREALPHVAAPDAVPGAPLPPYKAL